MNDKREDAMHNRTMRMSSGIVRGAVLLFIVALFSGRMSGQIYVSPTGSDTSDGSIGSPFATIGKAMSVVTAGGTIYLRDGIYYNSGTLRPNKSGSAGAYINLWAYPGEHPIVDFSLEPYSSSSRGFYLSQNYWYLKGLVVRYAGDNGIYITGAHNIVEDCVIYGNKDTGLQISGGGSYIITINSDSFLNYDSLTHGGNADGFDAKLDIGPGNEFHGCRAWNNSDDGYDLYEGQYRVLFDSCWSFHNGYNLWGDLAFAGNGNGFKVGEITSPPHIFSRAVLRLIINRRASIRTTTPPDVHSITAPRTEINPRIFRSPKFRQPGRTRSSIMSSIPDRSRSKRTHSLPPTAGSSSP